MMKVNNDGGNAKTSSHPAKTGSALRVRGFAVTGRQGGVMGVITGIIVAEGPYLSYCNECGQPALVLMMKLHGWKHTFHLCASCLTRFAEWANGKITTHEPITTDFYYEHQLEMRRRINEAESERKPAGDDRAPGQKEET
jgi:hypothetical protein